MGIARSVPAIVAGSAVAAFGFSFGRDVYKTTTKNPNNVLLAAAIAIAVIVGVVLPTIGIYYGALWLTRNYRTAEEGVNWRLAGLASLGFSLVVGYLPHTILAVFLLRILELQVGGPPLGPSFLHLIDAEIRTVIEWALGGKATPSADDPSFGGWLAVTRWLFIAVLAAAGILRGAAQRRVRRRAWDAESHNVTFMREIGLRELPSGQFEDDKGNLYRLEAKSRSLLEFFAIGRRNRRAYIEVDGAGKFTAWSGLTIKSTA